MKEVGIYLLIAGIGSILLNQIGLEFVLLSWIDVWGTGVGWGIRIAAIIIGFILVKRG